MLVPMRHVVFYDRGQIGKSRHQGGRAVGGRATRTSLLSLLLLLLLQVLYSQDPFVLNTYVDTHHVDFPL
jgi:hypothetical protein